jgi:2-polyprenyl-3-methyl-5-hydroxy-6-metoxy-1,4-benzoquinol methylase
MLTYILNKRYTFSSASIIFRENNILGTPWQMGTYEIKDSKTVHAIWAGLTHILLFNVDYTEFTSIRTSDGDSLKGTIIHDKSNIPYVFIDYKDSSTELCMLGKKYNVDKSSQRENPGPNDSNHCHPYTLVYDALFRDNKDAKLMLCEIGIAEGRSLLMWNEYFTNAEIYGFDVWPRWIDNWTNNFSEYSRVHVNYMNVREVDKIVKPLTNTGVMFDCIIDDSTHSFYDIIRIIKNSLQYIKPGGMIIIEDIQKAFDEYWFYVELSPILSEFSKVYFIDLEHYRRNSGTVNNDKLLILVKKGHPIFSSSLF